MWTDSPLDLCLEPKGSLSDIWHVFLFIADGSEGEYVMPRALLPWRFRKCAAVFGNEETLI